MIKLTNHSKLLRKQLYYRGGRREAHESDLMDQTMQITLSNSGNMTHNHTPCLSGQADRKPLLALILETARKQLFVKLLT
jgi:hypothetical protein